MKPIINHDLIINKALSRLRTLQGMDYFFLFLQYSVPWNSAIWLGSLGGTGIYINNKQEEPIKKKIATINLRD